MTIVMPIMMWTAMIIKMQKKRTSKDVYEDNENENEDASEKMHDWCP